MLENTISEWIECISKYYSTNKNTINYQFKVQTSNNQLKNDVLEFLEAKIVQEQANTSIMQSHPKAYYTSRNLTEILFQENSDREESNQGYELMIV
ncbi:unnamed protein product [Rhizophagus irregularis]|nr:unnamed protein product [Rhizophagus irregularis]CAB5372551.1 unnamed protein product [Rhizophagus irregularis]